LNIGQKNYLLVQLVIYYNLAITVLCFKNGGNELIHGLD